MFCPKCGVEIIDMLNFCENCGARLPAPAAPVAAPQPVAMPGSALPPQPVAVPGTAQPIQPTAPAGMYGAPPVAPVIKEPSYAPPAYSAPEPAYSAPAPAYTAPAPEPVFSNPEPPVSPRYEMPSELGATLPSPPRETSFSAPEPEPAAEEKHDPTGGKLTFSKQFENMKESSSHGIPGHPSKPNLHFSNQFGFEDTEDDPPKPEAPAPEIKSPADAAAAAAIAAAKAAAESGNGELPPAAETTVLKNNSYDAFSGIETKTPYINK